MRSILYESRCAKCSDAEEMKTGKKRRRNNEELLEENVYVGETSRSLYERTKEHIRDGKNRTADSHIYKHWEDKHQGEDMPLFRFRIVKKFRDTLSRQIAESTRIDLRRNVLNSKTVYSRNRLPRLEVERTEWEKEDEDRRKRILDQRQI